VTKAAKKSAKSRSSQRAGRAEKTKKSAKSHSSRRAGRAETTKKTVKDTIDIDQLAVLFGLPSWDSVDEMNQQHYWEQNRGITDEEEREEAEQRTRDEVYAKWYDAVERTASDLFGEHGLELQPAGDWWPSARAKTRAEERPHLMKVVPSSSWEDAAEKLRETITGEGTFGFEDLREFLRSGSYTARQTVLTHLSWIRRHPAVFGGPGPHQRYDQAWRH
jgi:hypothetical protein